MTKRPKATPQQKSTTHPETTQHVKPGVVDASSSKATGKARDGRTAHDKDGNDQQSKAVER